MANGLVLIGDGERFKVIKWLGSFAKKNVNMWSSYDLPVWPVGCSVSKVWKTCNKVVLFFRTLLALFIQIQVYN
jgi:hypothetical protein